MEDVYKVVKIGKKYYIKDTRRTREYVETFFGKYVRVWFIPEFVIEYCSFRWKWYAKWSCKRLNEQHNLFKKF